MKKVLILFSVVFLLIGCGNKKNNPTPILNPAKVILTAPAQNQICTTGTIISANESSLQFTWLAAANTNSYNLVLKNLLTNDTTVQTTTQTHATLNILRNTPFSWYVISKSTTTTVTAKSDVWKFYNSGPGMISYAPFPAELTSPTFGENISAINGNINLNWKGTSVNPGTIVNYDVYFGTSSTPPLTYAAITNSYVNNVAVISGTTYYWYVITRDIQGNTSISTVYQFTVK